MLLLTVLCHHATATAVTAQGNGMLAAEMGDLKDSSKEGSWVGEAGKPVADWVVLVYPSPQLVQPL